MSSFVVVAPVKFLFLPRALGLELQDHFSLCAPRHQISHWCVCARNAHPQQFAIAPTSRHSNRTPQKASNSHPALCPSPSALYSADSAPSLPPISTSLPSPQLYYTQYLIRSATSLMKPFGSLRTCLVAFFLVLVLGTLALSKPTTSQAVHSSPASQGTINSD